MTEKTLKNLKKNWLWREGLFIFFASILVGLLCFLLLYDRYSLYVTHVNWIYKTGRDPLQHQLGWEFFRNEPWRFPLGTIKAYGYPFGTTVTFLDSIPLFSFFFKLISPLIEEPFQFFGLWELTSIIGQLAVGMLILGEFTKSYFGRIFGASLLVLSPPMIYSAFFHSSLTAHWILLLGIWFLIRAYRGSLWRGSWFLLFFIAMLVHVYFIPMLAVLWTVSEFFTYSSRKNKWKILIDLLGIAAVIFLTGWSTGLFTLSSGELATTGYGDYSWNLNGFFRPAGASAFFPKAVRVIEDGQDEGFSYLGAGMIGLLVISLVLFFWKDKSKTNWRFFVPVSFGSLVLILYAITNKAYFNTHLLWEFSLPDWFTEASAIFRASGRFIWPVFYLIALFAIIILLRNSKAKIPILICIILVQFFDLSPLYKFKRINEFVEYGSGLRDDFWKQAAQTNDHIQLIPTEYYEQVALFAVQNGMTISSGYFGRADYNAMEDYALRQWKDLQRGISDSKTIYILTDPSFVGQASDLTKQNMFVCEIDGYSILFSSENTLVHSGYDFTLVCELPLP